MFVTKPSRVGGLVRRVRFPFRGRNLKPPLPGAFVDRQGARGREGRGSRMPALAGDFVGAPQKIRVLGAEVTESIDGI